MLKLDHPLLTFSAVCATCLALALPSASEAASQNEVKTKRHKVLVKKDQKKRIASPKIKNAANSQGRPTAKHGSAKKSRSKSSANTLKLSRSIEPAAPESPQANQVRQSIQINPKPPVESSEPPLQIGKTLYQRNGEIRLVEPQ